MKDPPSNSSVSSANSFWTVYLCFLDWMRVLSLMSPNAATVPSAGLEMRP